MIFEGKTILVTGGTGSLGKVLVRRILSGEMGRAKKVIVLSRDEAKQHDMRISYLHRRVTTDEVIYRNFMETLEFRIGDVRNFQDVCSALRDVNIVINAAALKQVPTCEYFPEQAIYTNCQGAINIVQAIRENGYPVETVLGVSTDKACKPINVMGITKSLQERIFIAANILNKSTRFIVIRYGNVLASRGSVVPLFHDQIQNKGPVTITDSRMTRFLLTLNQAVDTAFAALAGAKSGEIYIPIAPTTNIVNIARALIGDLPVEIKTTGIRPGEKLHEILISEEECPYTVKRGNYYVVQPMLPELRSTPPSEQGVINKEYSSADGILDGAQTFDLLKRNNLLLSNKDVSAHGELLA